ncbi:xanthine dehydrogenase family protein subunit M [Actinoplanes sp. M2I2]|uniref:FAD binding domain-containing protein n=1 Tax=Actinoplanes sp. M2I2 TaxID=1734444 RepID=UPI0020225A7E|nr:xanthine dehydrogenase family protein subunit M [Actinoplanes sp. M2I2]
MKPFAYTRAESVAGAITALGSPGAQLLAGGTTMYDLMKLRIETPETLVDIQGLKALNYVDHSRPDMLVLGAGARMSDVADNAFVKKNFPAISESLWRAASQQLRNMATLGGNLLQRTRCSYFRGGEPFPCNKREPGSGCAALEGLDRGHALFGGSTSCIATYPGDLAISLLAFDAVIEVAGPKGRRTVPLAQLHVEPGDTPQIEHVLSDDEIIVEIRVPRTPSGRGSTYLKIRDRESYAFALVSAATGLTLARDGSVEDCRIALGGVGTRPIRATAAERSLIGKKVTAATARAAGEIAFAGAKPGHHNAFRIELGIRAVADALQTAKTRAS